MLVSITAHLLIIVLAYFWYSEPEEPERPAFIQVELGEFSDGTQAEFSREDPEDLATHPDPADVETEEPVPEPEETTEEPQQEEEEPTQDVDLAEQQEQVDSDEVITTPETDRVDPEEPPEEEQEEEPQEDQQAEEDEAETEGDTEAGDIRGIRGDMEADQGPGEDEDREQPYELEWEGDLERTPEEQPLPAYTADVEAVIQVRFEVNPDGTVGQMTPVRRMNPELTREVLRTLREWRFSRLPSDVPQESQWGTITFRFVLD